MKNLIILFILNLLIIPVKGQKVDKLLKAGKVSEAIEYCEKKQGKQNCFTAIANYYLNKKDIVNAEKYFMKSDNPGYGYNRLADYYFKNKDIEKAEKYYLKLSNPDYGLEKIAKYYFRNKDLPNAVRIFEMIKSSRISQPGLINVADSYLDNGNYEKAEECYKKGNQLNEGYYRIADALFLEEKFTEAVNYYDKAGRKTTVEELENDFKEIIEKKTIFGLQGLTTYTSEKKISIFNLRIVDETILNLSFARASHSNIKFMVVISYPNEDGNTTFEPHAPLGMDRYYHHYTLSSNTITTKLSESSLKSNERRVYLIDANSRNSKAISNSLIF